jgi:hypothetical protein
MLKFSTPDSTFYYPNIRCQFSIKLYGKLSDDDKFIIRFLKKGYISYDGIYSELIDGIRAQVYFVNEQTYNHIQCNYRKYKIKNVLK